MAITGIGAVTPLGVGATALHERWVAAESGIADGAGRCLDFEPADHLSVKQVRRSDRFTQLALVAAGEAMDQAGRNDGVRFDPYRAGCVIGTGVGGIGTIETQHSVLRESGADQISPQTIPALMANAPAGALAIEYDLRGPSFGTVSACAAGAHAIGIGARMIRHGEADTVLAGGTDAAATDFVIASFARIGATSPSGVSRPFDRRRDGFVIGEGAGVLVLEAEETAAARGVSPLGWVLGIGSTTDAHHMTAPDPAGDGAARAMELALADADVTPAKVSYLNAHGTSTPLNDRAETLAIKAALGEQRALEVPVSSTKSAIGHLLGAAGAVEAIATLLALGERVAPPTLNWEEREEGLDLDYVPQEAKPLALRDGRSIALSNAFAFGGHNVSLCLEACL